MQLDTIGRAIDIMENCTDTIFKHLLAKRATDVQELVRKSVFEFLLQLESNEVGQAFTKENS